MKNLVIGHHSGTDLEDEEGVVIIGDGIARAESRELLIGYTLFGIPIPQVAKDAMLFLGPAKTQALLSFLYGPVLTAIIQIGTKEMEDADVDANP